MSAGTVVFLMGLFAVPVALLWLGHRLRRRTPLHRAVFWGALIGYGLASLVALFAAMLVPAEWSDGDTVRGFAGFWAMLLFPAAGAAFAAMTARR